MVYTPFYPQRRPIPFFFGGIGIEEKQNYNNIEQFPKVKMG